MYYAKIVPAEGWRNYDFRRSCLSIFATVCSNYCCLLLFVHCCTCRTSGACFRFRWPPQKIVRNIDVFLLFADCCVCVGPVGRCVFRWWSKKLSNILMFFTVRYFSYVSDQRCLLVLQVRLQKLSKILLFFYCLACFFAGLLLGRAPCCPPYGAN